MKVVQLFLYEYENINVEKGLKDMKNGKIEKTDCLAGMSSSDATILLLGRLKSSEEDTCLGW